MLNLVIFGAPGSGKGTQSAKLIDEYSLFHISTGEVLRAEIASGSELGKLADSYISKGNLIPDDLMIRILDDIISRHIKDREGIVFDGFPRTIPQAEALTGLLKKYGTELHAMLKRGAETGRADDNEETIKNRLNVYHTQTSPLQQYYKEAGKYIPVKGTGIVDEIFADIAKGIHAATGITNRTAK